MAGYDNMKNGEYKAQTIENTSSNQAYRSQPKQSKFKEHFRRFWWLHLISFIIGTIVVTLILIFVGMPNIAQNGINQAVLTMDSQTVSNPTPDSVKLYMVTTSHSKSSFHPWLDEFKAALFLENGSNSSDVRPFGYITIPRVKANALATTVVDQVMEIADHEQFAEYNKRVMAEGEYRVAVRGRVGLKEGSFPKTTVNFNKVITSKGLNALKGFAVQNITISLAPEKDGTNMRGQVLIPNPSNMTIQMGTITQNVFVDGQQIGVATIPNLELKPGPNLVPMSSVSAQDKVLMLITTKYPTGDLPVTIVGNSSVFNGQHLPYFEAALQSQKLSTVLKLGPALKAMGLDISQIGGSSPKSPSSSAAASSASAPPAPVTLSPNVPSPAPVVSSIVPPKAAPSV